MKLYIEDKKTKKKTYLRVVARNRKQLSDALKNTAFVVNGDVYTIYDVKAEASTDSAAVGSILGGLIGAIGGGAGVIAGGILGAAIGQSQANKEQQEAMAFNGSSV